ncbi:hypothetical protein [Actinomycetospora lemnae]|uniref:DUF2637 domain-containing protein n=1 Tax=Actinomycetospora lemnae TaxID=3019891 RepID=A0ABT5SZZ0_9PSEU|nr:hypothetical protein [Actinomycetospora sp. DW7H6]MDD7968440.1 hypothetical protein [Actinomycetospora sp. DW7H6]
MITDGLALVAYAATARLSGHAARYSWAVVIVAAGLSGLAQAVYLASGATVEAPAVLRFGVGAWPAVAAATVAHLLYLLTTATALPRPEATAEPCRAEDRRSLEVDQQRPVQQVAYNPVPNHPRSTDDRSTLIGAVAGRPAASDPADRAASDPTGDTGGGAPSPARDRARSAALRLAHGSRTWPTVSVLETEARVSRGTAATVLKDLRAQPPAVHLITEPPEQHQEHDTDEHHDEQRTQI